jgi:hypothetical protein
MLFILGNTGVACSSPRETTWTVVIESHSSYQYTQYIVHNAHSYAFNRMPSSITLLRSSSPLYPGRPPLLSPLFGTCEAAAPSNCPKPFSNCNPCSTAASSNPANWNVGVGLLGFSGVVGSSSALVSSGRGSGVSSSRRGSGVSSSGGGAGGGGKKVGCASGASYRGVYPSKLVYVMMGIAPSKVLDSRGEVRMVLYSAGANVGAGFDRVGLCSMSTGLGTG